MHSSNKDPIASNDLAAAPTKPISKSVSSKRHSKAKSTKRENAAKLEPFSTFTCFPRLPAELQLKIWGTTANAEKAVIIQVEPPKEHAWKLNYRLLRTGRSVPALLHTCRQSRAECIENDALEAKEKAEKEKSAITDEMLDEAAAQGATNYKEAIAMITAAAAFSGQPSGPRKSEHARWRLVTFNNCKTKCNSKGTLRMFFSATIDTFWPLSTRVRAWSNRSRRDYEPLYLQAPEILAANLHRFASTACVEKVEDIALVVKKFPKLQTITCLLNDWITTNYKTYFTLQPETGGNLTVEGLPAAEKLRVQRRITRVKLPNAVLSLMQKEEDNVKLLRFRFEIQFVKSEVPELKSKSKYRRPKPKAAIQA